MWENYSILSTTKLNPKIVLSHHTILLECFLMQPPFTNPNWDNLCSKEHLRQRTKFFAEILKWQKTPITVDHLTFRSIVLHINNLNSWTEIYCDIRKIGRWEESTFSYNTGLSPTEWIRGYKMEKKMIGAHSCLVCAGSRLKTWKVVDCWKSWIGRYMPSFLPNLIYWIAQTSKQLFVEK